MLVMSEQNSVTAYGPTAREVKLVLEYRSSYPILQLVFTNTLTHNKDTTRSVRLFTFYQSIE